MEREPHTRLAGECLQPLGHLSRESASLAGHEHASRPPTDPRPAPPAAPVLPRRRPSGDRSRPRLADPVAGLARRSGGGRHPRAQRHGPGHCDGRRPPQRALRPAARPRRARAAVLHQLPLQQGPGARGQSPRRGGVPVGRHGPPGRGRRPRLPTLGRGVRRLLRHPAARAPARRDCQPAVAGDAEPGGARRRHARDDGPLSGGHADPAPAALGRLPPRPGDGRVLGGPRGSAARPAALSQAPRTAGCSSALRPSPRRAPRARGARGGSRYAGSRSGRAP